MKLDINFVNKVSVELTCDSYFIDNNYLYVYERTEKNETKTKCIISMRTVTYLNIKED